jgi:wobble nucleotide-excising tRNase
MGIGIGRVRQWGIGRLLSTGAAGGTSGQRTLTDQLFDVHKILAQSQQDFYKALAASNDKHNDKIGQMIKDFHEEIGKVNTKIAAVQERTADSERFTHRSLTLVRRLPS